MDILMSTGLQVGLMIGGIILFIGLIILLWWINTANSFRKMKVKIEEAASGIDVALTKRFDLLTKMIQAVKGSMEHEKDTLARIVQMRLPSKNASMPDKAEFSNELTNRFDKLNVTLENYPELKAASNVVELQKGVVEVEENLQASRRLYNSNVSYYNQKLVSFPSSVVANKLKLVKEDFFEAEESKKQDVKIDFR